MRVWFSGKTTASQAVVASLPPLAGPRQSEAAAGRFCLKSGYSTSVVYDLPKVERRVRLPLPAPALKNATLAQLAEQRFRKAKIPGSNPGSGSIFKSRVAGFPPLAGPRQNEATAGQSPPSAPSPFAQRTWGFGGMSPTKLEPVFCESEVGQYKLNKKIPALSADIFIF